MKNDRALCRQPMRNTVAGLAAGLVAAVAPLPRPALAQAEPPSAAAPPELLDRLDLQGRRIDALQRLVDEQSRHIRELQQALDVRVLGRQRGRGSAPTEAAAGTPAAPDAAPAAAYAQADDAPPPEPVGQAPEAEFRPPEVAQIFEQPGVLTPPGRFVLEPSLQYSYSSSNRIALVGYTIIPAILIGVIDVREVKRNSWIATLTGRWGVSNRFELEARVPYVWRSDSSVGREILQGSATSTAFDASGHGIGDVELTARWQLNEGGLDRPYYVGSLRFKSRTGKDPFEVETATNLTGLREGVQTELPTGSGFYGLQPALTVLFPSDPVVYFGSISYLHSFARSGLSRLTSEGREPLGRVQPGGVIGFNFGMGLALNEKASFSVGYDHSSVGKTKQNGRAAADAVRVQLGTLLLGYSYRLSAERSLNVSLGIGATRDTPDVTLTVRVPVTF